MTMRPHHEATIARATEAFRADLSIRAVIVGGSVAKGTARPDSDVDLMLVVSEAEYARRRRERDTTLLRFDLATYDGGYVDAKYVDISFLEAAAVHGSEPARDAFRGTYAAWSSIPGLDDLLARIPVYPEAERETKMRAFYSQMLLQLYFLNHNTPDPFLPHHSADTMVFFGSRLLLAYHRVLYPNAKRLMERVAALPTRPVGYFEVAHALLRDPSRPTGDAYIACLNAFHDWGLDWNAALGQYTEDAELNWLDGHPPLADS